MKITLPPFEDDDSKSSEWADNKCTMPLNADTTIYACWCTHPFRDLQENETDLTPAKQVRLHAILYKCTMSEPELKRLVSSTNVGTVAWKLMLERFNISVKTSICNALPQIFKAKPREFASLPAHITGTSEWRQILISNGGAMPDALSICMVERPPAHLRSQPFRCHRCQ